jgi:hypothetical protein
MAIAFVIMSVRQHNAGAKFIPDQQTQGMKMNLQALGVVPVKNADIFHR